MRTASRRTHLILAAGLAALASTARAGAPLVVDPVTGKPWVYGPGTVRVYHDLGDYAVVTDWANYPAQVTFGNAVGADQVRKGFGDWSSVPTTSLRAVVQGSFAALGLPDITGANADLVIGTWNGGGVHVIFDADGSVMESFFGVGPNVLGISSPEFGDDQGHVTESWTVLNGQAISADDPAAAHYQGVATHEFGHALGLAHTQTNGASYFYGPYTGEPVGPQSCSAVPYRTDLTAADVETMYPYSNPDPTSAVGLGQAHVHTTDDRAAISDLYPGPGWPASLGTITGTVLGTDGKTPLTGVNVIARNLDDPFADASSALSGQWTQGLFGPDGTFTLHGLRPGGRYVIYVDAVVAGGFPTPPMWFLPGAERFYAGPPPKGDGRTPFDPCAYQVLTARAGGTVRADVQFELVKGAPVVVNLGYAAGASAVSGDGSTVVGNYGRGTPPFRWTARTGVVDMDVATTGEITFLSHNGKYVATNLLDVTGASAGAFRWDARGGWVPVTPVGSCGTDTTGAWGVADDGTVYGLAYNTCLDFKPFRWSPATGTRLLPTVNRLSDGKPANGRPNQISADGSVLAGWEENDWGGREAVVWVNGVPRRILDASGQPFNEATAVSGDGRFVAGGLFWGQQPEGYGWRKDLRTSRLEYYAPAYPEATPARAYAMSRDGGVMAGFSGDPWFSWIQAPLLWTPALGSVDLNQFLVRQGTAIEQYFSLWEPMGISDDGTVMAGWGAGTQYWAGWVLQMPKVFVCHLEREERGAGHTLSVAFPGAFDEHLRHGDAAGPCPDYRP